MKLQTIDARNVDDVCRAMARDAFNAAGRAACGIASCNTAARRVVNYGTDLMGVAETADEANAINDVIAAARFIIATCDVNGDMNAAAVTMTRAIYAAGTILPFFALGY